MLISLLTAEPFIALSVSLWNNLADPVFDSVGLAGIKNRANAFLLPRLLDPFLSFNISLFLFFPSIVWYCGAGVFRLIGCKSLSPSRALATSFNDNNNSKYLSP